MKKHFLAVALLASFSANANWSINGNGVGVLSSTNQDMIAVLVVSEDGEASQQYADMSSDGYCSDRTGSKYYPSDRQMIVVHDGKQQAIKFAAVCASNRTRYYPESDAAQEYMSNVWLKAESIKVGSAIYENKGYSEAVQEIVSLRTNVL